jgi:hypothetical protein
MKGVSLSRVPTIPAAHFMTSIEPKTRSLFDREVSRGRARQPLFRTMCSRRLSASGPPLFETGRPFRMKSIRASARGSAYRVCLGALAAPLFERGRSDIS